MTETSPAIAPEYAKQAEALLGTILARHDMARPFPALLKEVGVSLLAAEIALHPKDFRDIDEEDAKPPAGLEKPDMMAVAERVNLPAMPEVAVQLERVTGDPTSSASEMADVIALDPSLSTILLHVVNSAFYNFPQKIDSIPRAVSIVGTSQLHALALGRMVLNMANEIPPRNFNMDAYWEHCISAGVLARELAILTGLRNPERHFLAGLLHDIGKLALASTLPRHQAALNAMRRRSVVHEAETTILGFTHARFGALILRKWDIPYQIVEAVANHHHPEEAKHPEGARILHVADIMARTLVVTSRDVPLVPPVDPETWRALGIDPQDLRGVIRGLEEKIKELAAILTGKAA